MQKRGIFLLSLILLCSLPTAAQVTPNDPDAAQLNVEYISRIRPQILFSEQQSPFIDAIFPRSIGSFILADKSTSVQVTLDLLEARNLVNESLTMRESRCHKVR